MLDAWNLAEHYREQAEGCRRLATIALSTETRNHFVRIAEHYRTLPRPMSGAHRLLRGILPKSTTHKAQVLRFSSRGA
jgi:hypothetical protein